MRWPFGLHTPPELPVPVPEPEPVHTPVITPRVCKCGSPFFTLQYGLFDRGGTTLSISLPVRARCIRCGTKVDETNWATVTRVPK